MLLSFKLPAELRGGTAGVEVTILSLCAKSLQACQTLCNPMDCSLPGSSVHGILQVRILEWVVMLSSRGIFPTWGLNLCILGLPHWQVSSLPLVPHGKPYISMIHSKNVRIHLKILTIFPSSYPFCCSVAQLCLTL